MRIGLFILLGLVVISLGCTDKKNDNEGIIYTIPAPVFDGPELIYTIQVPNEPIEYEVYCYTVGDLDFDNFYEFKNDTQRTIGDVWLRDSYYIDYQDGITLVTKRVDSAYSDYRRPRYNRHEVDGVPVEEFCRIDSFSITLNKSIIYHNNTVIEWTEGCYPDFNSYLFRNDDEHGNRLDLWLEEAITFDCFRPRDIVIDN